MPAAPCLHAYVGAEGETLAEPGRYCGAGECRRTGAGEANKGKQKENGGEQRGAGKSRRKRR